VLLDLSHDGLKLAQVPVLHQLFEADIYLKTRSQPSSQLEKNRGHSSQTVVTPKVHGLSMLLFQQHFKLVRPHKQEALKSIQFPSNLGEIHGASPIIKWIGSPSVSSTYDAVRIGKTIYKV